MRKCFEIVSAISLAITATHAAHAQHAALNADSLLHRGLIERAESVYYADARNRPRDPVARYSLGSYLIERGARRIGMTLIEEAQQFGFDKGGAGRTLAPLYLDLGEYAKLSALPSSPLSTAEKERARYLEEHPTRTIAVDSIVTGSFAPSSASGASLGTVAMRVNGHPVNATIVNGASALTISDNGSLASSNAVHRFGGANGSAAVADSVAISRITTTNVPIVVAELPAGTEARVGLAFLARYAPTFDPRAHLITLRASGSIPANSVRGNDFSTLVVNDRYSVLKAGGWSSVDDPAIMSLFSNRRWTLDAKHGVITLAQ
jgi:hypothetical protein